MTLNKNDLASGLASAWAGYPATTLAAAQAWADAYDSYALLAQACSLLTPTLVNKAGLISALKDAFDAGGSWLDVAEALADAHTTYWTGAQFGATGLVVAITGAAALKTGLAALWELQSATLTLFPASSDAHASLLDTFTKTVQVLDTAVPPPSGCGPSPIT